MTARKLLARLDALGVELTVESDRLRVSASRGRLDDELKQAIGAHKQDLLELLAHRVASNLPLAASDHGSSMPLSYFQERLWVLQRLQPENTDYLLAAGWQLPHGVDLQRAVAEIGALQRRHRILHSVFVDVDGMPSARVVDAPSVAYPDLRALTAREQQIRIDADVERAIHTPTDLAVDTARFTLYRIDEATTYVVLSAHHIAVDAWSISLLKRELEQRLAAAPGASNAAVPLQYADFAAWQRRAQSPEAIASDLDWWEQALKGAPQQSTFAADQTSAGPARGATLDFAWDAPFSAALRELVREEGATIYMALCAACATVLRAHTGQDDLLLGSPMGVRERPELETLVGPFINLLVLRLDLSADPSFAQLLRRARDTQLDAHAHRHVSFEMLLDRLRPQRSMRHSPLFQVAVVQHNAVARSDVTLRSGGALHEVTWFVHEVDGRFAGSLEYRSDLYSREAIGRIASQLETLLRAAVADRRRPISRLALLDATEREALLRAQQHPELALDPAPIARQFERQAAMTPQRIALTFESESLDYATLNARANRLARRLREAGVVAGVLVAVCLERSSQILIAMLAVLKAGGAYVPLDPDFPAERLAFMLADSGAPVLLIDGGGDAGFETPAGVLRIDPRAVSGAPSVPSEEDDLESLDGPESPAYVIYTSGSTGKPKGVVVPQRALSNFIGSMRLEPGLAADDVLAAVTTISFDIAALELYLPLVVGARIELLAREIVSDGEALAERLAASGATVLQATPATWRLLLEAGWQPVRSMRALCGGEALPRELADALLPRVSELWNLYGPTETTIWSTLARVQPAPAPVTIGKPIANTQVYVLDTHGEPVPVDVPGELWIGGAGVATGYHRRPELTAERFVPDRFSGATRSTLYRTGDLAQWDAQGRLHHLGRIDQQVKVRGFRIELGEIEAALEVHAAVRQAVVVGREAAPGDLRLVAYLVFEPNEDLTVSDVRRHLRRNLPEYMIPSVVMAVAQMPQTPNGKIDRGALPDPFKNVALARNSFVAPAPGIETAMAEIWSEILKVDQVGAEDNFYELGGYSLLSLRVAAAVQQRLGVRIEARAMFFQNLRQIAELAALPTKTAGS